MTHAERAQKQNALNTEALAHFQAGRLREAEAICNKILRSTPQQIDSLNILAAVRAASGSPEEAVKLMNRILALVPQFIDGYINRSQYLQQAGRLSEALQSCKEALALQADHPGALLNLGTLYLQQGDIHGAKASFTQLAQVQPTFALAHFRLGDVAFRRGQFQEAIAAYDHALTLAPPSAELFYNRALALNADGRYEEALRSFTHATELNATLFEAHNFRTTLLRRFGPKEAALASAETALRLAPDSPIALDNYAHCLLALKRNDDAIAAFDKAVARDPENFAFHSNRSSALFKIGRLEEAVVGYELTAEKAPHIGEVHSSLGLVLQSVGRYDEAETHFDRGLELAPHSPMAQFNRGIHALLTGDFARGWPLYEARYFKPDFQALRTFTQPVWLGENIRGKTILLHAEQGLGDTLQFCRYVPLVEALGAKVLLDVQPTLARLMTTLSGHYTLVNRDAPLPAFDVQCPLLSLPRLLLTTLDTVPATIPYLTASIESVDRWQKQLGPKTHTRIGLVWSGASHHENDANRSIPLSMFAPLFAIDAEFHSLQKELRPEDAATIAAGTPISFHGDVLRDMNDTAGLVMAMDHIISVDTSIAHLAGALGKPLTLLLAFTPDFRWLLHRNDSPWYPTARLLRQPKPGDWETVLHRLLQLQY